MWHAMRAFYEHRACYEHSSILPNGWIFIAMTNTQLVSESDPSSGQEQWLESLIRATGEKHHINCDCPCDYIAVLSIPSTIRVIWIFRSYKERNRHARVRLMAALVQAIIPASWIEGYSANRFDDGRFSVHVTSWNIIRALYSNATVIQRTGLTTVSVSMLLPGTSFQHRNSMAIQRTWFWPSSQCICYNTNAPDYRRPKY